MKKQTLKIEENNDLHIKINDSQETLLEQDACTILNVTLNNSGEITTNFFGLYNEKIFDYLTKLNKTYLKALRKKLINNKNIDIDKNLSKVKSGFKKESDNNEDKVIIKEDKPNKNMKNSKKKNVDKKESINVSTKDNKDVKNKDINLNSYDIKNVNKTKKNKENN